MPNCRQCEYYFVTWKKDRPHGCKAYGFLSYKIPSTEVFINSGIHCLKFSYSSRQNTRTKKDEYIPTYPGKK